MKILFSLIVAIIVLAVAYTCALIFMKKQALRRKPTLSDTNEHGVDLQARRKTFDDLT